MSERPHKRRGPVYFLLDAWRDDRTNFMANVVIALSAYLRWLTLSPVVKLP